MSKGVFSRAVVSNQSARAADVARFATGGVFVAGGIAPKILEFITDGRFLAGFLDKGRMRVLLERMPVQIVLDSQTGLLGAAALAAREAQFLQSR